MFKKVTLLTSFIVATTLSLHAQSNCIPVSAVVPEYQSIPEEARAQLENKVQRMITMNGMGASNGSRIVMTAKADVIDKGINSAGLFYQKLEITFYIGDVVEDRIYGSCSVSVLGAEENENKCLIKAFQTLKPGNTMVQQMLNKAKAEIYEYYHSSCGQFSDQADGLAKVGQYEEAIGVLMSVPNIDSACYRTCQTRAIEIYNEMQITKANAEKARIEKENRAIIQKAKAAWFVKQDYEGAEEALDLLSQIDTDADCVDEASLFMESINKKLRDDEKRKAATEAAAAKARWEFKMRQYEDKYALDVQKQADKAAILGTLAGRFGKIDIGIQKETTKRWGSAK